MDPEEDNSNFVSSSGSSPVLFSDPEAVENILQITSAKNAPSELGKRQRYVFSLKTVFPSDVLNSRTILKIVRIKKAPREDSLDFNSGFCKILTGFFF